MIYLVVVILEILMKRDYEDKRYEKFRRDVRKRDNHTCQWPNCGATRKLKVHHICKWTTNYFMRYEVSNGIVLCRKCHDAISGLEEAYAPLFHHIVRENSK